MFICSWILVPGSLFLGVSKALSKYFILNSCSYILFLDCRSWRSRLALEVLGALGARLDGLGSRWPLRGLRLSRLTRGLSRARVVAG